LIFTRSHTVHVTVSVADAAEDVKKRIATTMMWRQRRNGAFAMMKSQLEMIDIVAEAGKVLRACQQRDAGVINIHPPSVRI
jgi:hypothetical protein